MAHEVRIVTEAELRAAVRLDQELVDVVERAFVALAGGGVVMPPVMSMHLPQVNGEVDVKTAWIPGFDSFAIKVSPGFFDNPAKGLASLNGLMMLLSGTTGLAQAVYLDNGYLTDLRTAAAGAVAARHLAPAEVETAAVFGTGVQARLQMEAAHLVRPFRRCLVWGRDPAKAAACAEDIAAATGADTEVVIDPAAALGRAQLAVTTTPATEPILSADWLHPGLHVTAMGSDQAGKQELDPRIPAAADLFVCDNADQCRLMGEWRGALASGDWAGGDPVTLGEIAGGTRPGRTDITHVTLCDLTGTGAQDTAIANHVAGLSLGTTITT